MVILFVQLSESCTVSVALKLLPKSNIFSTSAWVEDSPSLKFHTKSNSLFEVLVYSATTPSHPGSRIVSKVGIGLETLTKMVSI